MGVNEARCMKHFVARSCKDVYESGTGKIFKYVSNRPDECETDNCDVLAGNCVLDLIMRPATTTDSNKCAPAWQFSVLCVHSIRVGC